MGSFPPLIPPVVPTPAGQQPTPPAQPGSNTTVPPTSTTPSGGQAIPGLFDLQGMMNPGMMNPAMMQQMLQMMGGGGGLGGGGQVRNGSCTQCVEVL